MFRMVICLDKTFEVNGTQFFFLNNSQKQKAHCGINANGYLSIFEG